LKKHVQNPAIYDSYGKVVNSKIFHLLLDFISRTNVGITKRTLDKAFNGTSQAIIRKMLARYIITHTNTEYYCTTPLLMAVRSGCTEAVQVVLDSGADIDSLAVSSFKIYDEELVYVLDDSLFRGDYDMVRFLLSNGAEVPSSSEWLVLADHYNCLCD
jgi:hypothetical protein